MPISSQLQTLLTQFQSRYPTGCLCAELLTIHQEQYVVRAVVQSANVTLATAMAAATEIEVAEDRSKVRALEALGLTIGAASTTVPTASSFLSNLDSAANPPAPTVTPRSPQLASRFDQAKSTSDTSIETTPLTWKELSKPEPVLSEPALSEPALSVSTEQPVVSVTRLNATQKSESFSANAFDADDAADHFNDFTSELPNQSSPVISPSVTVSPAPEAATVTEKPRSSKSDKSDKSSKRKAESFELPPASATPPRDLSDRSEEIMKIGIEMKRLGWSTEQGREYLKRTYGKRSRQELDEAELLDFLRYLEVQSSPLQTPF